MKLVLSVVVCCSLLIIGCGSSKKVTGPPIPIMFSDFEGRAGVDAGTAQIFRDAFAAELQKTGRFTVVDRSATGAIMQEKQLESTQTGENAKMPKLHSLKKMISGSVGKLGEDYVFNIKMTDLESAAVDFAIAKTFNGDIEDVIEDFLPQLAREVLQSLEKR